MLQVHTSSSKSGEADKVAVAFKVLLLPSFFAQAVKADTENKHNVQPVSPLFQESTFNMILTDMHQVMVFCLPANRRLHAQLCQSR